MLYCFIVSTSYSSTLKSYMTAPVMSKSLNSINDIVNGPLPWEFMIYFNAEEDTMAKMENKLHKKLWRNKISLYDYQKPVRDKNDF